MSALGLNTGLKALLGARFMLDTVGHNLTNANTPGYSRQRVHLEAALAIPLRGRLVGSGVDIGRIERSVDRLLERRIGVQTSVLGGLGARLGGLSELESFLGAQDDSTLSGLFDGFYTAISDLSTAPADPILRTGLLQTAHTLTTRFHSIDGQLDVARREAGSELRSRVSEVNAIAAEISSLNVEVARAQSTGAAANDLLDRRDRLVRELSELVDVTTVPGANGTIGVLVGGSTLVGQTRASTMSVYVDAAGEHSIRLAGSDGSIPVTGGAVGGLLELVGGDYPTFEREFDRLARELIRSVNRVHSTGLPPSGSFSILTGSNRLSDFDGDGKVRDELLSNAGLPFEVTSGALWVNVEDRATGELTKHRVAISRTHTTVQGFLDELNAIPHLTADVDTAGRLRIQAESGYGFDFSRRLVGDPDPGGAFGGTSASLATAAGPFALADGDALTITADPGGVPSTFSVVFDQADFVEISRATASEVAAAINADASAQANGVVAVVVGEEVVLQTVGEGAGASFQVESSAGTSALGLDPHVGSPVAGSATSVEPRITGAWLGDEADTYSFRPASDGTVGSTVGLRVEVRDAAGDLVTTLDVGSGYVPGTPLAVAEGIEVSFGFGELSATHGDVFALELVPDPDTADVLVALGLNGFFEGSGAADIAMRRDLAEDPDRIATSASGAGGDSALLLALLGTSEEEVPGLGGASVGQFYGDLVASLGSRTASTRDALAANDAVVQSLEHRRDQISGVNVDEELVDLVAFEQAFQAASRYIGVVSELQQELLSLI